MISLMNAVKCPKCDTVKRFRGTADEFHMTCKVCDTDIIAIKKYTKSLKTKGKSK